MPTTYRVLVVDDDYQHAALVCELLRTAGAFVVDLAMDSADMWDHLDAKAYDVMLFADRLSNNRVGGNIALQVSARHHSLPVVIISDQGDERAAVQAIRQGAADYIVKRGEFLASLPLVIFRAIQAHRARLAHERAQGRAHLLMDNLPDAVVAWDLKGQITLWNSKAEALLGRPSSECLGHDAQSYYFSHFIPPLAPPATETPEVSEVWRQARTRGGQVIDLATRLVPIRDAGQVIGYMHVSRAYSGVRHESADRSASSLEMLHDS
jgi:PAS domain S-box-containing protein